MTAPLFWARFGPRLEALVTETDVPVQGDSILRNQYQLPMPDGQLWERVAEKSETQA